MTSTTTIRKSYGNRRVFTTFAGGEDYSLRSPKQRPNNSNNLPKKNEDVAKLTKYIDDNVIGKNHAFLGPFGRRKIVYCDYAASGRSLQFIEEYISREVLPMYGNTHSSTSITSLQSTNFRHEARDLIKNATNASNADAVIFTGHGCTDALQKLISALDLRSVELPIVFTSSSEHHDNLHLWEEIGAKMIRIAETKDGFLDLEDLEHQLSIYQKNGRQMIGCFSVASNVTGIVIDDIACTILLHQYNALAFWDYNIAAPSIQIDMNPLVPGVEENSANKDAIYFSGHKFIGGVQTPGILIAKRTIFRRLNSCETDGFFTSMEYNKSFEIQEEGSCAAVIESIRAGLVIQLKETVTVASISQRQEKINKQMLQHIRTIPEIILLGNLSPTLRRIPVFSFMVRHPRGTFLHHNFVCAVLNDVFGIQARAGCPCSGAYAQDLLGIDPCLADQYESIILEDRRLSSLNLGVENSTLQLLRPGFTRISLPYFITDAELAFIMEAVKMVATEGWKLLPQYVVDLETGEWRHHTNAMSRDRKWLASVRYVDGKMTMNERRVSGPGLFPQSHPECLQTARNLFNRARKAANKGPYQDQGICFDARGEKLRWFMLQNEAQSILTSNAQTVKQKVPFDPIGGYGGSKRLAEGERAARSHPGSPRHFSLPSIDDPRLIACSSPVPYFLHDVNGLYYPQVNFSIGESVSAGGHLHSSFARERCLSLGAPNVSPPILSPQMRVCLDSDANLSPTHSLQLLSNHSSMDAGSQVGRGSPAPDIQTYVTERTKELATNIKSELREVISRVEDVLENTDCIDYTCRPFCNNERHSGSEDGRSDSISANEVAEYIEKVSIEMANEVKSEIRDVVSAVDVFITPDQDKYYSRSSSDDNRQTENSYTPGSSSETVIHLIHTQLSDEERRRDNSKSKVLQSAVGSVSSQDSGINLSFHEQEYLTNEFAKTRSNSESIQRRSETDEVRFSTLQKQRMKYTRTASDSGALENMSRWSSAPKTIWQPTVEAIHEFEMIKDGDKVMVGLSGGKDSLSLLHTLLQYQQYALNKGILFSLGAITVDPDSSGCDLCTLIPHLRRLGVHYIIDDRKCDLGEKREMEEESRENLYSFCTSNLRQCLYSSAKSSGYNVLAIAQHFDDLCESFFLSVFHTGRLRTMRAHSYLKEHKLRIIRPFVYVRDKYLRQFVSNQSLPVSSSVSCPDLTKQRQRIKQVLTQQEILFPKLFSSLRTALHPLIGFQIKECEVKCRRRLKSKEEGSDETDEEPVAVGDLVC